MVEKPSYEELERDSAASESWMWFFRKTWSHGTPKKYFTGHPRQPVDRKEDRSDDPDRKNLFWID